MCMWHMIFHVYYSLIFVFPTIAYCWHFKRSEYSLLYFSFFAILLFE